MTSRVRHAHLHHASFVQPHEPAFWVFVALLLYGVVRIAGVLSNLSSASRSGWALSWLLLLLYAAPMFVLIHRLDLYEREPIPLALAAFAWGAFAATALSLDASGWDQVVEHLAGQAFAVRWAPAIAAPLVEETLKGAGVVLVYLIARDEVDDAMDGFVYGALCGLGFAVIEDVIYFMATFGGTPAGVLQGFYVRVLSSGLYGHVLYTGLVGLGIGTFVTRRRTEPLGRRVAVAAAYAGAGVAGHAIWNAPWLPPVPAGDPAAADLIAIPLALAVRGLPMLILVAVAVRGARSRERRWLGEALAGEVAAGELSDEDLAVLRVPSRRRAEARAMRARAGRAAAGLLRRLRREQLTLAMLASRVRHADDPALVAQRGYCRSLRLALASIPGAAPAGTGD